MFCAIGAALAFSANDMVIKFLSGGYPLHQIVFVRATLGLIVTMAVIAPLEGGLVLRTKRLPLHLVRGLCVVIANMAFFASIAALPLADATAIFFISPLVITGLSVLILKEHVGPRRWAAVAVGMIGVVVIVRPTSASFQVAALLPMLAAFGYAMLHIFTRRLGVSEKASTMAIYIQVTFILVSGAFGLVAGDGRFATSSHPSLQFLLTAWVWPEAGDFAIMVALGVLSAGGGYLITQAYRISEAGLVAPFEYLALVMANFWGFTIFGEVPTLWAAGGMALILASGLYLALREAGLGKRPAVVRHSSRR